MPQHHPTLHWPAQHVQRLNAHQGLRLHVLQGRLWLTRTGLTQDVFVHSGQSHDLHGHGWVLEAEQASELRLVPLASAKQEPTSLMRGLLAIF